MSDQQTTDAEGGRAASLFDWVNTHVKLITVSVAVLTVVAAVVALGRSEDDPNFDPSGEIYDTLDLVDSQFQTSSPIADALFIVEGSPGWRCPDT